MLLFYRLNFNYQKEIYCYPSSFYFITKYLRKPSILAPQLLCNYVCCYRTNRLPLKWISLTLKTLPSYYIWSTSKDIKFNKLSVLPAAGLLSHLFPSDEIKPAHKSKDFHTNETKRRRVELFIYGWKWSTDLQISFPLIHSHVLIWSEGFRIISMGCFGDLSSQVRWAG